MLRRCAWKYEWVEVKRRQGPWRDVRVYDADDLEQWLLQAPEVHVMVTRMLGRNPEGVEDLATAWGRWSRATARRLPQALFLTGRDREVRELDERLQGAPQSIVVRAASEDEALAFLLAGVEALDQRTLGGLLSRTLVVHTEAAWDNLLHRASEPLILLPRTSVADVVEAIDAGHHVLFAVGQRSVTGVNGDVITIPRLRRADAREALRQAGIPRQEADRLAATARRSLTALRRRLAVSALSARPHWAGPDHAPAVVPALLAGAWKDDVPGDREALVELARCPYETLTARLAAWLATDDPPVRRLGNTWYIADAEDALELLQDAITPSHVERLRALTFDVLTEIDPASELPADRRWAAALLGRNRRWSGHLRSGLAGSLAMLAARAPDCDLGGGFTGQTLADDLVDRVLRQANSGDLGELWASLSDVLPLLAEAAPRRFCETVELGLIGDSPALAGVFDPGTEVSIFGSPTHTGLLWALERLAWSRDHFADAVRLIARLAQIDPGGRWTNRPTESLREIYLPWLPQTSLDVESRLAVLDEMREELPDVAWKLMRSLLPHVSDSTTGTDRPRWREWVPDDADDPHHAIDPLVHATELIKRMVPDAGESGERWRHLIEKFGLLPPDAHGLVVDGLRRFNVETATKNDLEVIREALRHEIARHRRFPETVWSMPDEKVIEVEQLLERFDLVDGPLRYAWLFSRATQLSVKHERNWDEGRQALACARRDAVIGILASYGLDGVWALVEACEDPDLVGRALGEAGTDIDQDAAIIEHLESSDGRSRALAEAFVTSRFHVDGAHNWEWARARWADMDRSSSRRRAGFLACIPPVGQTLDWAESDPVTSRDYWERFNWVYLTEPSVVPRVVRRLLDHGRGVVCVNLLSTYLRGDPADGGRGRPMATPDLIGETLEEAIKDEALRDHQVSDMFSYDIARLLSYLAEEGKFDVARIAQLEWMYLLHLERAGHSPKVLHTELTSDPRFFAEVVSLVYAPDDESEAVEDVSEDDRARAHLAYRLLDHWTTPPGTREDGSIDPDALWEWVEAARDELSLRGRRGSGERQLGRVLRYSPEDFDGTWPPEAVRRLIEDPTDPLRNLQEGLEDQAYNDPGQKGRTLQAGAPQARRLLARRYRAYANKLGSTSSRTARLLQHLAERFERDAQWAHDLEELSEDLGP